ncbi:MAG: FAD:protein FMN transferase [Ilumatobacteraceae bacterium]
MRVQLPRPTVQHATWRAMGSAVEVVLVGAGDEHLDLVREVVAHLENRWSRFVATSDVSRLNRAAGDDPVCVDASTVRLLEAMASGAEATDGAYDPTLLAPLVSLGYAASWEDPAAVTSLLPGTALRSDVRRVLVDRRLGVVQLPPGAVVDAGGIGKGLAADIAVEAVLAAVPGAGAMVSIGGDVRVAGAPPDATGWVVAVADEPGGDAVTELRVVDAGIATSGTMHRSWRAPDGTAAHHLIDPRSGASTGTGPRAVVVATVVAGTAAWAEVWTKALVVDGVERTLARLDDLRLPGRVRLGDGSVITNSSWSAIATGTPRRAS